MDGVITPESDESASDSRGKVRNTCSGCPETWTAVRACHCGGCHRTFAGIGQFDAHRSQDGPRGRCLDPGELPNLQFRNGMWRGPEMTEEQIDKLRQAR